VGVTEDVREAWKLVAESPDGYSRGLHAGLQLASQLNYDADSVVFIGVGGSGIVGELIRDIIKSPDSIPLHVVKDFGFTHRLGREALLIAVSYSGETAETLTASFQSYRPGVKMVAVTSDGTLKATCDELAVPVLHITAGQQARYAVPEMVGASFGIISGLGLAGVEPETMRQAVIGLREFVKQFEHLEQNPASEVAEAIIDRPVVVYGHTHLLAAAYRLKTQLNENSKHVSFFSQLPEACHNEVEALSSDNRLAHVIMKSRYQPPAISGIVEWMEEEFSRLGLVYRPFAVDSQSHAEEVLRMVALADFVTVRLAAMKNVNPLKLSRIPELRSSLRMHNRLKEYVVSRAGQLSKHK